MNDLRAGLTAGAVGTALAALILILSSGQSIEGMVRGDAAISQYVASHLTTPPAEVHPAIQASGSSLRYGRVGFPLTIWASSFGQAGLMRYTQPVIVVLSAGAIAASMPFLLPGSPLFAAVSAIAVPGVVVSIGGSFGETLAMACALWGLVLMTRRRWYSASGLLAFATLSKETVGAAVVGSVIWLARKREHRGALVMGLGLSVTIAWHVVVWIRFGHLPLLDPFVAQAGGLSAPGVGLIQSLSADSLTTIALTAVHMVIALTVLIYARSSLFGTIALLTSLQLLNAAPDWWTFIGDSLRVNVFLQVFALAALLPVLRKEPSMTLGEPTGLT